MKIFKKLCNKLGKAIGMIAFAASIRWSKGQYENKSFFINDNYINKTISNYSSTEMDFYNPNEEKAGNGNRVRLGSGEIISLSTLNGSITSRTMQEAVLKLRAGDDRLIRSIISKAVNLVTRKVSEEILSKPNITSHSFRIGYITQLWKDSKDIEFVKQTIGRRNLDTTSAYVNQLSDQERQKRIDQLK